MQNIARLKERLVFRRKRLGWTQETLAEKAGVSVRSISNYEQGLEESPGLEQLSKLAKTLSVNVGWLIGEVDEIGQLKDEPITATDPESVRLALRVLKNQMQSVIEQVDFYERQICGPIPSSSKPDARTQHMADEILKTWEENSQTAKGAKQSSKDNRPG